MKKYISVVLVAVLNLVDLVVLLLHADMLFERFATLVLCIAVLLIGPTVLASKLKKVSRQDTAEYKLIQVYGAILLFFSLFILAIAVLFVINYPHRDLICAVLMCVGVIGVAAYAWSVFCYHRKRS